MLENKSGRVYFRGTRILTEPEIKNMSDGSLRLYFNSLKRLKASVHSRYQDYCDCCREYIKFREPTEKEVSAIIAIGYAFRIVKRERHNRSLKKNFTSGV